MQKHAITQKHKEHVGLNMISINKNVLYYNTRQTRNSIKTIFYAQDKEIPVSDVYQ